MAIRKMICITCPRGCHLEVDDETLTVRGNTCEKGAEYGKNEVTNPRRVLTSTVKLEGGSYCRLPVKTAGAIPKELLFDAMDALDGVTMHSPVHVGDVVVKNLLGTGIDVVATKNL